MRSSVLGAWSNQREAQEAIPTGNFATIGHMSARVCPTQAQDAVLSAATAYDTQCCPEPNAWQGAPTIPTGHQSPCSLASQCLPSRGSTHTKWSPSLLVLYELKLLPLTTTASFTPRFLYCSRVACRQGRMLMGGLPCHYMHIKPANTAPGKVERTKTLRIECATFASLSQQV